MWLRKGNLQRETESLLIAAQNNVIRSNHIKTRIDKTQQNSRCRLCDDRRNNHIISKCSKLAQKKYKTRHDWVGKVIHWELCKKLKQMVYAQTQCLSWRMRRTNSWDFEIQTDHLILAKQLDVIIINKIKDSLVICRLYYPS